MRTMKSIKKEEIRDLLGKGWLTHDGMWFYQTAKEFGIDKANELNRAAIKSMSVFEVERLIKILGIEQPVKNLDEIKKLMLNGMEMTLPVSVFSKFSLTVHPRSVLRWEWENEECFAYKGMKRMELLDGYECGVIYRIECWFEHLGIKFNTYPTIWKCMMHEKGYCRGAFEFLFSD
ncbi:MAG: hypothetical protein FJ023_06655 [Chloroflexi bacterium]|nr:hypothetical protein [Chloroflexota bacterium]